MNVFVTGATGVVGLPTITKLVAAGHAVRAVARGDEKAGLVRSLGAEAVAVDLFDGAAVKDAVVGSDAVLHLATNVPPLSRAARKNAWATHNRLRTEATAHLVQSALDSGVSTFVKESVTFVYPDCGDRWIEEDTPADDSIAMLQATLEGERLVEPVREASGHAVVLRFGLFYGPGNRATDDALRLARFRAAPVAGRPGSYMSSIHTDDAASAVVAALDAPSGTYNVVDDEPLTRREYVDAFTTAFGRRRAMLTPGWLLKLVAGAAARVVTSSQRCSNRRFRGATGWAPAYPCAREGWEAVARARS